MPPQTSRHKTIHARTPPGATGQGRYWRIIVRPSKEFVLYRYHDMGRRGGALRLAGLRPTGSWATQAWLIDKHAAHIERRTLVAHSPKTQKIIETLPTPPRHIKGDIFIARPGKGKRRGKTHRHRTFPKRAKAVYHKDQKERQNKMLPLPV